MKTLSIKKEVICTDDCIRIELGDATYILMEKDGNSLELIKVDNKLTRISIQPINGNSIIIK